MEWLGERFQRIVNDRLTRRLEAAGKAGSDVARRLVPVDTGKTRQSIGYFLVQSERKLVIYAGTSYSIFLELGTYRMAPRPFLRPGMYEAAKVLGGRGKATGQAGSPSGPKKVG